MTVMDEKRSPTELYKEGFRLFMEGKYHDALKRLNKSLEKNPNAPNAWYWEAETLRELKCDEAKRSYDEARSKGFNMEEKELWFRKGICYGNSEHKEAIECYDEANF